MCGFAFGFDRVMLAIKAENIKIKTKKGTDILIIPTGEKMLPKAIEISNVLRKKFSCEIDLLRRRLRKALAFADGLKIPYVIIVGEEEMKKGKVILRNMNTGEQKEVAFSALGGLSLEGN
jgi:histidyl-tRNA synthetase